MSWAAERRTFILVILGLIAAAILAWVIIAALFKEPTCADGVQNQDEQGIDCGGSCAYLCSALLPSPVPEVVFMRALSLANGRTDVIAYVVNKNSRAAVKDARYQIELYSADQVLLAKHTGSMDIPASAEVPVFMPNLFSGGQKVSQAFLSFDEASLVWFARDPETIVLQTKEVTFTSTPTPRVNATLLNNSATPLMSTKFIATLYDAEGNAMAASQTIVTSISAFETATAVFTWAQPFATEPARIDVRPVPLLP